MSLSLRSLSRYAFFLPMAVTGLLACNADRAQTGDHSLYRFTDCGEMRTYVADVMLETLVSARYGGWGYWDLAAEDSDGDDGGGGDGPTDYTTTNVQEEGVDEIDIVKTDGQYIYTAQDQAVHIVDSWPVEDAEKVATVELDGWARGLFLKGDSMVVFEYVYGEEVDFFRNWSGTRVTVFDVSDRSDPEAVRTIDIDGYLADGRMVDGDIYLVLNHWLSLPEEAWDLVYDDDLGLPEVDWSLEGEELEAALEAARDAAREILDPHVTRIAFDMDLEDILPMWRDQLTGEADADAEMMHECTDVYRPADTAKYSVLSVAHLDVDDGDLDAIGVMSDGWTVYASADNLYVAQTGWWWWWGWGDVDMSTHIHKFKLDPDSEPTYEASGSVSGWLYDQFAMSEHDGYLRVATTDFDWWWWTVDEDEEEAANNIYVLGDDGDGTLEEVGHVGGIAPGERIYASRMMGDKGYIVTFLQVDPLWTIDLSDPENPEVIGELEVPGYSAYLHPMGEDHLLAIGMDGEEDGTLTGLAVNVFDVSDFENPTLAHQYTLESEGWTWSEAMWDHHAFTFHRDVLSIPAYTWDYDEVTGEYDYFSGLIAFGVDADEGIEELGRVDHRDLVEESECLYEKWYDYEDDVCDDWYWYASLRRSVYIEDNLFSISNYGIKVNELMDPSSEIAEVLFYPAE